MRYYRLDPRKMRYGEFIRVSHPHGALAALVWLPMKLGLVRLPIPLTPRPDTVSDMLVEERDLPEPARTAILSSVVEATSLGFEDPVFEVLQTQGKPITGLCVRCRHNDHRYFLQGVCSFAGSAYAAEQYVVSIFKDGSTLATSNGRPKFDQHPASEASYYPGRPLSDLLETHRQALSRRCGPLVPVKSREDLIRQVDAMSDRYFDFMVSRGVFKEVAELPDELSP